MLTSLTPFKCLYALPLRIFYKCSTSAQTFAVANDRIFDCPFSLNSVPTTPFILVPSGSPFFPINAQALLSNLITLPSFLCTFFFVRTTIACLMSPRFTLLAAAIEVLPPGPASPNVLAFWTTTIMRSPKGPDDGRSVKGCPFFHMVDERWKEGDWVLKYRLRHVFSF